MDYPRLFEPLPLGPYELRNRVLMTVHGGLRAERNVRYYEDRAAGGVGMMIVPGASRGVQDYSAGFGVFQPEHALEFAAVAPDPASAQGIAYFDAEVTPALRALADAAHRHGTVILAQIYHLGAARGSGEFPPTIAPSAIRDDEDRSVPHELDEAEIATLVTAFGHAARRAREAGMDGVELHGAHGYLINQFLSPWTNRRTDRYGGSVENRARFLHEIVAAVDELAGQDFPVGLRINATDLVDGGMTVAEAIATVDGLADRLLYVSVSSGNTTGLKGGGVALAYASPWLAPLGHNADLAAEVRRAVNLPVAVAGRILEPEQAEQLLAEGSCDIVGMARALLADPQWPSKTRTGRARDIRPCISNNDCHGRGHMLCAVNPFATREAELALVPADRAREVLVVGGGPAGTEAARVAAERGHQVRLYEREPWLGGQARTMALDPDRSRLAEWLRYQERQLAAAGVAVHLGEELDAAAVAALAPEVVVQATGGRPVIPDIPGLDAARVHTVDSVLCGTADLGARVLVVGALEDHMRPLTIADLLARRGHAVTLASQLMSIGQGVEKRTLHQLLKRLMTAGVTLLPMTAVTEIDGDNARTRHVVTGTSGEIETDSVVLACGSRAADELRPALATLGIRPVLIGDCLSPRQIAHAILDGARAGRAV